MDEDYQTYLNRVARTTLLETYNSQLQHIQESPKFQLSPEGGRQPVPFPGYSVITPPPDEDAQNQDFYQSLRLCQEQLLQLPLETDLIVPVPFASFHLTLADLIWDNAFPPADVPIPPVHLPHLTQSPQHEQKSFLPCTSAPLHLCSPALFLPSQHN